MFFDKWLCAAGVLAAAMTLAAAGCGGPKEAGPKTAEELSEIEKQQIQELNEQRQEEWGTKK
jgi:hypothetical protein